MELDTGIEFITEIWMEYTSLTNLSGFNPTSLGTLSLVNNGLMTNITLPVQTISDSLFVQNDNDPSPRPEVNLPNLATANNITIIDVNRVELPNLKYINQSLGLYGNTIDQFFAPLLHYISGSLSLWDNNQLTLLDLSALTTVGGGINITNNAALTNISGLSALEIVTTGGCRIEGDFVELDLPKVESIGGTFSVLSSDSSFNCSAFEGMLGGIQSSFERGYYCDNAFENAKGSLASTTGVTSGASSTSTVSTTATSAKSNSISTGAKAGIAVACVVVIIAVTSACILYMRTRKKRDRKQEETRFLDIREIDGTGLPRNPVGLDYRLTDLAGRSELDSEQRHVSNNVAELL